MRAGSGNCASHQTLSAEAASVLKHSLSLSRRRGHAQVTPLHVAATLLTSRACSLLRRACLRSHHHPLQCRALELCFNVALNRLPATPAPLLSAQPSLSNALVAALKRAQAHQRRGCVDQQQPLVAVKVELEQLVVSILDDPSVSRVMREAGFSSAAVKNNIEDDANSNANSVFQCYNNSAAGIYSTPNSPPPHEESLINHTSTFWHSHLLSYAALPNEDANALMEALLKNKNKRKNTVIVADTLSAAENAAVEIMRRVERGDAAEGLKSAHFIKFELSSVPIKFMNREEVEMNIGDLKKKVESFAGSSSSSGVVIYTGDLKWTVDDDEEGDISSRGVYRPVDHLVSEVGKLLSWYNNNNNNGDLSTMRVWLIGIANYQTYMKCQMKQPPLDLQWALQPLSVPTAGLGLSLNASMSGHDSRINLGRNPLQESERMPPAFFAPDEQEALTCCAQCKSNYEKESSFMSMQHRSFSSQSTNNGTENGAGSPHLPFWLKPHPIDALVKDDLVQLRRKYNKLCQSLHSSQSYLRRDNNDPSSYSCWPNKKTTYTDSETISFASNYAPVKTSRTASSLPRFRRRPLCHIDFSFSDGSSKYQTIAGPNLDSLKGTDDKEFKITLALGNLTYNDQKVSLDDDNNNYAGLVKLFQENIPWQSETVPSILEVLLADHSKANSQEEFILIKGNDEVGKRRFAVGIAEFVFGSSDLLLCMNMRKGSGSLEMVEKALRDHEKLVVLVEDVDYADCEFLAKFLNESYKRESGRVIFILTMDEESRHDMFLKEKVHAVIQMKLVVDRANNNDHRKRKADWDFPVTKNNSHRSNEAGQVVSSTVLDLNIEADDQEEVKTGKPNGHTRFLEKIKNHFVFNRDSDQEARGKEMFLHKLRRSFEEVRNDVLSSLVVEEKVLEEVLLGSGLYLNSLFQQWVKEVFETSLRRIDRGGEGERVSIRLCSEGGCPEEDGFMRTCLPKSIQLSLTC